MRLGLLINPSSRQNRKGHFRPEPILKAAPDTLVARLEGLTSLPEILNDLAKAEVDVIAVSGGDGTAARILTALAEGDSFASMPKIALLPHGTTNMTAADIGLKLRRPESLARLSGGVGQPGVEVRKRPTIRVANPKGTGPQHGMFFGAGAIYRAILKAHTDIHTKGFEGEWANGATLFSAIWRTLTGADRGDDNRIYQPTKMQIHCDRALLAEGGQLLFIITSLDRLVLSSTPFWNSGDAPLRATAIGYPLHSILGCVLPIMYGWGRNRLDAETYRSIGARRIDFSTDAAFTLDGELFEMPDDEPLNITAGPEFEFICGKL